MSPLHQIIAKKNPALAAEMERQLLARNEENSVRLQQLQAAVARCMECEEVLSIAELEFVRHAAVMTAENYGGLTSKQEWWLLDIESRLGARMSERCTRFSMLVN